MSLHGLQRANVLHIAIQCENISSLCRLLEEASRRLVGRKNYLSFVTRPAISSIGQDGQEEGVTMTSSTLMLPVICQIANPEKLLCLLINKVCQHFESSDWCLKFLTQEVTGNHPPLQRIIHLNTHIDTLSYVKTFLEASRKHLDSRDFLTLLTMQNKVSVTPLFCAFSIGKDSDQFELFFYMMKQVFDCIDRLKITDPDEIHRIFMKSISCTLTAGDDEQGTKMNLLHAAAEENVPRVINFLLHRIFRRIRTPEGRIKIFNSSKKKLIFGQDERTKTDQTPLLTAYLGGAEREQVLREILSMIDRYLEDEEDRLAVLIPIAYQDGVFLNVIEEQSNPMFPVLAKKILENATQGREYLAENIRFRLLSPDDCLDQANPDYACPLCKTPGSELRRRDMETTEQGSIWHTNCPHILQLLSDLRRELDLDGIIERERE